MKRLKQPLTIIATALLLQWVLERLPDALMLPLFCRVPATFAAAWFNVPLEVNTLNYTVNDITFEMARSCSAETFFSIATAIIFWRNRAWTWCTFPLTLFLNSLRAVLTATLTLTCHGTRLEALIHLVAGAALFIGTLYLLWILTERRRHEP